MCSEKWHTVVESPLRNVKLLEEKRLQQILDQNEMPFLHVTKEK